MKNPVVTHIIAVIISVSLTAASFFGFNLRPEICGQSAPLSLQKSLK